MGRRRDNPKDQRAKGFPGRRKSKTLREIEKMERDAQRDAKLFADASAGGDLQALPVFLADKRLAAAQRIWMDNAPRLDTLHMLSVLDRMAFASYCIYAAEFVLANKDLLDKGYSIAVPTIAKDAKGRPGTMLRENPSVARRDYAHEQMLKIGEKFGFTPLDRHNLIAKHIMRDDDQTLFNRQRIAQPEAKPAAPAQPEPPAAGEDGFGIGTLSGFDTPTPDKLQ